MSAWTNFLGLHSWRYAKPLAVPFAIFSLVDHERFVDGCPFLPAAQSNLVQCKALTLVMEKLFVTFSTECKCR